MVAFDRQKKLLLLSAGVSQCWPCIGYLAPMGHTAYVLWQHFSAPYVHLWPSHIVLHVAGRGGPV